MQRCDDGDVLLTPEMSSKFQLKFYPSVFDPPDCHLSRIGLLNICFEPMAFEPNRKFNYEPMAFEPNRKFNYAPMAFEPNRKFNF